MRLLRWECSCAIIAFLMTLAFVLLPGTYEMADFTLLASPLPRSASGTCQPGKAMTRATFHEASGWRENTATILECVWTSEPPFTPLTTWSTSQNSIAHLS